MPPSPVVAANIPIMKNVNTVPREIGRTDLIFGITTEIIIPKERNISWMKNNVIEIIKNIL